MLVLMAVLAAALVAAASTAGGLVTPWLRSRGCPASSGRAADTAVEPAATTS
ncbi:hypothetical protein COUCH_31660 [Couchioplanes caeruleus]|uniref:hypothetical protein n=1 Tax=Couchioplanes caeruleus TaxID=56438 RepID=UPI0020C02EC0|nr:hypothetical protein [Couchioplanes caeruleus]UQU63527.1 hypothetical protein COUCH_31660 [Couchioplanes caeruleus]